MTFKIHKLIGSEEYRSVTRTINIDLLNDEPKKLLTLSYIYDICKLNIFIFQQLKFLISSNVSQDLTNALRYYKFGKGKTLIFQGYKAFGMPKVNFLVCKLSEDKRITTKYFNSRRERNSLFTKRSYIVNIINEIELVVIELKITLLMKPNCPQRKTQPKTNACKFFKNL